MGVYNARGIIIGHQNWREADKFLSIYSEEYGKIKVMAKGARKITSKLAGSLEPLILANIMVARGKNNDTVVGSDVIINFKNTKNNLAKVWLAGFFCNLIDSSTKEHQKDTRIFQLLLESLHYLEAADIGDDKLTMVKFYFVWRYLVSLGYQPELYKCQVCGLKILPGANYFSNKRGGVLCHDCYSRLKEGVSISENAMKVLRLIHSSLLKEAGRLKLTKPLSTELLSLTDDFLDYMLEDKISGISK